jgi:broad specificity phosphatase PhoE
LIVSLAVVALAGCGTGYQGGVYQRMADGSIGPTISQVAIKFVKEDGSVIETTTSDASGRYSIALGVGRYRVTATHPSYEDYSSAPGFFVVTLNGGLQTGNIFLYEPTVTVVLLVRHADRDGNNDALKVPEGTDRAQKLADVVAKAGVTAIYSTSWNRTRATAEPSAEALDLEIETYGSPQEVANLIGADHPGDVVLVVGHSNTQKSIIETILEQEFYPDQPYIEDFDNLFVIGKPVAGGHGSVVNLQYGADTGPDIADLSRDELTTLLLLRHAETSGNGLSAAGHARAQALAHKGVKSGIDALYAPQLQVAQETVQPLAVALGKSLLSYDSGDVPALAAEVFSDHSGETVLIVAEHGSMRDLLTEFGATPFPPVFAEEHDHLMVIFALTAGASRLTSLQYGDASP